MAPMIITATTLATRNTPSTKSTTTILVLILIFVAFCIASMLHAIYIRKIPLRQYVLTSANPIILLVTWPFHLFDFMRRMMKKVHGRGPKKPDDSTTHGALVVSNVLNQGALDAFSIDGTPTQSNIHPVWNVPTYVPLAALVALRTGCEHSVGRFEAPLSVDQRTPYAGYVIEGMNVIGGENAAYFEVGPSSGEGTGSAQKNHGGEMGTNGSFSSTAVDAYHSLCTEAAMANAREVERVRMVADDMEAERVRLDETSASASQGADVLRDLVEEVSHVQDSHPVMERLFTIPTGQPEFVHPVARPASVAGFIEQCTESLEDVDDEPVESTQTEAEAAQRFKQHAQIHEVNEARFQADIQAAVIDLSKKLGLKTSLDMHTAWESVGTTESNGPSTSSSLTSSCSSKFPFRSDSAPTFAATVMDWEAEEVEEETTLLAAVVDMFTTCEPKYNDEVWRSSEIVNEGNTSARSSSYSLMDTTSGKSSADDNPNQHAQNQNGTNASVSPASSFNLETYSGNSRSTSENHCADSSEVCSAAGYLLKNTTMAAENNNICDSDPKVSEEDRTDHFDVPFVLETEELREFVAAALPFFRSQLVSPKSNSKPRSKPLNSMVMHWEAQMNQGRVQEKGFVPDWKFEKDMAR